MNVQAAVNSLEARMLPTLRRWADEPHMASIRESITPSFIALGAVTAIAFFQSPRRAVLPRFFDAYHIGFGAMGFALAVLLADRLARRFNYSRTAGIILTLGAFIVSLPHPPGLGLEGILGFMSATSLFLALVVALTTCECLRLATRALPHRVGALLIAAGVLAVIFGGLAAVNVSVAGVLLTVVKPLVRLGDTLPALLIVVLLQTLLWSAGVHGPAFLAAVVTPVYLHAIDQNSQAVLNHQPPPYIVTITLFTFFFPGGSGATLPLALLMLRSRAPRLRKIAYAALLPSLANLNEPLIFGIPIVMNPSLVLPFIGVPLLLATITYAALRFGLVDKTVVWVPGAVPSLVASWITTKGDWRAVLLVVINVAIGLVCYLPFLRAYEKTVGEESDERGAAPPPVELMAVRGLVAGNAADRPSGLQTPHAGGSGEPSQHPRFPNN